MDIGAYEVPKSAIAAVAVGWGTQTAALQTAADGLRLLPAGRNTDLPWLGIDELPDHPQPSLRRSPPATSRSPAPSALNYGPVTISGSGTSYTITLAQPITKADRVTITIGNATIATFTRRLDVLPGDFNDDGVVNSQDLVGVRNEWLRHQRRRADDLRRHQRRRHRERRRLQRRARLLIGTSLPSVSDASIAPGPASQGWSGAGADRHERARRSAPRPSRARPRAEIRLSGRGWSLGTLTRGKAINQPLIEKIDVQDATA